MIGELHPSLRQQLDRAIDFFEAAMNQGDAEAFNMAKQNLLSALASLGIPYDEYEVNE